MSSNVIDSSKVYRALMKDFDSTIKKFEKQKNCYIDGDDEVTRAIIVLFLKEKRIKFDYLPVILKNTIVKYAGDNFGSDELIDELLSKKLINYNYLPLESDYADIGLVDSVCKNSNQADFLRFKLDCYSPSRYTKEDEIRYIKLLGSKYSDCNSVEDVLRKMHEFKLTRDTMSVFEMFSFKLYACKVLNKNNINLDVSIFNVDGYMLSAGGYDTKKVKLHINALNNSVISMLSSLNHEIVHAIQDKNIRENKISDDYDIDLYIKDKILKDLLGNDYYTKNYGATSYEFDADIKAQIMTAKILNLVNIKYNHDGNLGIMSKNAFKVVEYADREAIKNGFKYDVNRSYGHINKVFERVMKCYSEENPSYFEKIVGKYSFIKYEYNCNNHSFRRKTIKELIADMDKCVSNSEKGIYYNILKNRFNEDKENRDDVREAIKDIIEASKSKKYNNNTKKILLHLVDLTDKYSDYTDKYKGYFNRTGGNKR